MHAETYTVLIRVPYCTAVVTNLDLVTRIDCIVARSRSSSDSSDGMGMGTFPPFLPGFSSSSALTSSLLTEGAQGGWPLQSKYETIVSGSEPD